MPFYALQVSCTRCGGVFVIGGSAQSDLPGWRTLVVECRHCGADVLTEDAQAIRLASPRRGPTWEGMPQSHLPSARLALARE